MSALFAGITTASSTSILDLTVELPDVCETCGASLATIGSSGGPHYGRYLCAGCRAHRRWMSRTTYRFLTQTVGRFGRPHEPIRITSNSCTSTDNPAEASATAHTHGDTLMQLSEMYPSKYLR